MQTFPSLLGTAAGTSSTRPSSPAGGAQDGHRDPGGFDRLMQTSPRDDARASAQPAERMQAHPRERTQQRERAADAEGADTRNAKTRESQGDDGTRRTGANDGDDAARDRAADDDAPSTATAEDGTAQATTTTAAATPDAAPATLPEQLLALLNGLATAPAAAMPAAGDAAGAAAAAADAPAPNATGLTRPLPVLQPAPAAIEAAPAANAADNAFAQALGTAANAAMDVVDGTLDVTARSDVASPTLSVSSATVHPLGRATAAAVQANQPIPVDAGFEDGFGSRIAWLAEQKVGHAEIRVSPDHLGTIDVRLQLDGNRVNAEFHSAHADVRQALESSLPRLREMLGQQGLQLGQADVGQRQAQQQSPNGQGGSFAGANEHGETAPPAGWTAGPAARATRGLLDEYA